MQSLFNDGATSGNFHNLCFLICDMRLRLDLSLRVALETKSVISVKGLEQCLTTSKGYNHRRPAMETGPPGLPEPPAEQRRIRAPARPGSEARGINRKHAVHVDGTAPSVHPPAEGTGTRARRESSSRVRKS